MNGDLNFKNFKASDLLRHEETKKRLRRTNYKEQYQKCLDWISTVNEHCHTLYTTYTVPFILPGEPNYQVDECATYLKDELRHSEFYAKVMNPGNELYISWRPEDVEKVRKRNDKKFEKEEREREKEQERRDREYEEEQKANSKVIRYNPSAPFSDLHLRATLIKENPRYGNLKSVQRFKKKKRYS